MLLYMFFILAISPASLVDAQSDTDAENLYTKLFTTNAYNYRIRPIYNQSHAINVNVSFYLFSLNELNEVTETLSTTGYLSISWYDEKLQWNRSDYGDLFAQQWPQSEIWKPDIALQNSVLDYKELGVSTLRVENYYDGEIVWFPFQVFQSTCSVDVTHFPFDTQTCDLTFVSWSYTKYEVVLNVKDDHRFYLDQYSATSSWDVLSTSSSSQVQVDTTTSVIFSITIKRKPLHFVLSVVLPISLLAVLNVIVFLLPSDGGEKAGYAITVFLSFAVFLTIVSSSLPENSVSISVFNVYLIMQTTCSTLIAIVALVMIRLCTRDDSVRVPSWLTRVLLVLRCRACKKRSNKVSRMDGSMGDLRQVSNLSKREGNFSEMVDMEDDTVTWKEAVNILDRICFVFFSTCFVLVTITCFGYSSAA